MSSSNSTLTRPEASPYARHIPALDGVRGLAVLAVAASHLFPATAHSHIESMLRATLSFGANGVDLFFVLSGFLITGILYDSLPDPSFFRKFYARRALRIFPLYYGVVAFFAIEALIFGLNFHHELLSIALYLQNTSLITQPIRDFRGNLPLAHFWSLAIEEQFYLVWPITVFLLRKKRRLFYVCVVALIACPLVRFALLVHGVNYFTIHTNTACRADSLLAGGALALLLRTPLHDRVLRAGAWLFGVGIIAVASVVAIDVLYLTMSLNLRLFLLAFNYSVVAATSTGLMAVALSPSAISTFFSLKPMRWLGKYSYGMYVLHVILFTYLEQPIRNAIRIHITSGKGAIVVLTGLLIFFITIVAAYLSYNLYEKHFLRLKRYFDYRRHPDTVA